MKKSQSRRSLRNIKLTWRFYDRVFLNWIVCVAVPIVVFNYILYDFGSLFFDSGVEAGQSVIPGGPSLLAAMGWLCAIEGIMLIASVAILGILTTHRLTGPYINLKKTCEALRDGDLQRRLRFRKDDRLDDIAEAFNAMVDRLQQNPKA